MWVEKHCLLSFSEIHCARFRSLWGLPVYKDLTTHKKKRNSKQKDDRCCFNRKYEKQAKHQKDHLTTSITIHVYSYSALPVKFHINNLKVVLDSDRLACGGSTYGSWWWWRPGVVGERDAQRTLVGINNLLHKQNTYIWISSAINPSVLLN